MKKYKPKKRFGFTRIILVLLAIVAFENPNGWKAGDTDWTHNSI